MAKKTVAGLLAHCKSVSNWKYVYGMKGQIMSSAMYNSLKSKYPTQVWNSDANKVGQFCCDCSGLISSYTKIARSSSNYASTALATATISQLKSNWEKYVGWGIWMNGHIGVVSDTVGYYYAMDGSSRNWVHFPIQKNSWAKVIKLCDIDYSEMKTVEPKVKPTVSAYPIYSLKTDDGIWLPFVSGDSTYAGIENKKCVAIMLRMSDKAPIKYRVHANGKWLGWVTGCKASDYNNGYAGNDKDYIDAVEIKCDKYDLRYKISTTSSTNYLPEVKDAVTSGVNSYAGAFGRPIDKLIVRRV